MFLEIRRPFRSYHPACFSSFSRPHSHFDDFFGLMDFDTMMTPAAGVALAHCSKTKDKKCPSVSVTSDKFQVNLNVKNFTPEEMSVKIVDNCLVIEGKHEEKQDADGFISRNFVRRYTLPEGVKADMLECNLAEDGVMNISAPLIVEKPKLKEVTIPIAIQNGNSNAAPASEVTQKETEEKME